MCWFMLVCLVLVLVAGLVVSFGGFGCGLSVWMGIASMLCFSLAGVVC